MTGVITGNILSMSLLPRFFNNSINLHGAKRVIIMTLHVLVLVVSVALIAVITLDALQNKSFLTDRGYMSMQLWVCLFFITDIIIEWLLATDKRVYWRSHIVFLLVSVPYLPIIAMFNIKLSGEATYLIQLVPLIRTAYIFLIVTGMMSRNWISSLFSTYVIVFVTTLYLGSLMFFVEEHYINRALASFGDALWWGVMNMTTCGSNISAITPTGKTIAVVLSGVGLILFPVFTVYITNVLSGKPITESPGSHAESNEHR